MSEGKKFDSGKAPIVQGCLWYFPNALAEVARVSDYGRRKYDVPFDDRNWRRVGSAFERYTDAMLRHVAEEFDSTLDAESGLLHAAHAAWNALARLELLLNPPDQFLFPDEFRQIPEEE